MARKTGFDVDEEGQIDKAPTTVRKTRKDHVAEGEAIAKLTKRILAVRDVEALPLSASFLEAVLHYRGISSPKARGRQQRRLNRMLRSEDLEAIEEAISGGGANSEAHERHLRDLERWRSRLLDEGDPAIAAFVDAHPQVDRQQLRQAVRKARVAQGEKQAKAAKALFRLLRDAT